MKSVRAPRSLVHRLVPRRVNDWVRQAVEHVTYPADFSPEDVELCESVSDHTMTSPERVLALRDAVRHVVARRIPGDFVECGVWRGGSMMVVARTLLGLGERRELHLFDTFEGMSAPTAEDVALDARRAKDLLEASARKPGRGVWCIAGEEDVRANVEGTGYPRALVRLVRGKVEDTLPAAAPGRIALLRLDTDWYESTRHELEHLYPRLSPGGVLLIDDYGYWKGARKAVDEYFASLGEPLLLHRIDITGRLVIKP